MASKGWRADNDIIWRIERWKRGAIIYAEHDADPGHEFTGDSRLISSLLLKEGLPDRAGLVEEFFSEVSPEGRKKVAVRAMLAAYELCNRIADRMSWPSDCGDNSWPAQYPEFAPYVPLAVFRWEVCFGPAIWKQEECLEAIRKIVGRKPLVTHRPQPSPARGGQQQGRKVIESNRLTRTQSLYLDAIERLGLGWHSAIAIAKAADKEEPNQNILDKLKELGYIEHRGKAAGGGYRRTEKPRPCEE